MRCLICLFFLSSNILIAQELEESLKQKAYYALINAMLSHSVDEVRVRDIEFGDQTWLDARSQKEFDVSRIEGTLFVGYDDFDISSVKDLDKSAEIIVYCSIGYRSEKVAEKLEKAGFENVKNIYGGLFDWFNQGKPVLDDLGNKTKKVHGFGRTWGVWLNDAETVY